MEMQNVDNGRSEGVIAERRRVRADQPFQNEALQRHTGAQPASMAQAVAMATSRWHDMMYQREAARSKENEVAEKALGLLQHALKLEQHRFQSPSDGEYRGRCRRRHSYDRRSRSRGSYSRDGRHGHDSRDTQDCSLWESQHADRSRCKDDGDRGHEHRDAQDSRHRHSHDCKDVEHTGHGPWSS